MRCSRTTPAALACLGFGCVPGEDTTSVESGAATFLQGADTTSFLEFGPSRGSMLFYSPQLGGSTERAVAVREDPETDADGNLVWVVDWFHAAQAAADAESSMPALIAPSALVLERTVRWSVRDHEAVILSVEEAAGRLAFDPPLVIAASGTRVGQTVETFTRGALWRSTITEAGPCPATPVTPTPLPLLDCIGVAIDQDASTASDSEPYVSGLTGLFWYDTASHVLQFQLSGDTDLWQLTGGRLLAGS